MTITSAGYGKINGNDGKVGAAQWSQQFELMGADYGVTGDSWRVTPVTTGGVARSVQIAPGVGYGRGIVDTSSATETVQAPTFTGSAPLWYTVVAHRDWSIPSTTLTILPGTSSAIISPSRAATPGTLDDHPLALIRVESNTGFPTAVVDLRKWNGKLQYVNDIRGVVDPGLGDEAVDATGVRWRWVLANGLLRPVRVGSSSRFQRSGSDIAGVSFAAAQVPVGTLTQYGVWHGITTVSGRSELSDTINFDVPFSALLNLQLTQVHRGAALSAPRFAEYASSPAGFMAAWIETVATGNATAAERAFRWAATGVL